MHYFSSSSDKLCTVGDSFVLFLIFLPGMVWELNYALFFKNLFSILSNMKLWALPGTGVYFIYLYPIFSIFMNYSRRRTYPTPVPPIFFAQQHCEVGWIDTE